MALQGGLAGGQLVAGRRHQGHLGAGTAQRLAAEFEARLRYTGIDEILEAGLHSRLTEFIDTVRELARAIHRSYLEVV
ncbi:MAG: alpha-E domain-containing protein [Pseudomonas veronii]|nr:alpha-E domain-containing protein [Pseudomonas veronii]